MALPVKGDIRRPLALAIRSTRLLGVMFIVMGLFATLPFLLMRGGRSAGMEWMYVLLGAIALFFYMGPGVVYLLCALSMKRGRAWAVTTALILAGLQGAFVLVAVAGQVLQSATG